MLQATANQEWWAELKDEPSRTWEQFKLKTSSYIEKYILPEDAYARQVTYLQERMKPSALTAKKWLARLSVINGYLPYFFGTLAQLKAEFPDATFPDYWITGGLQEM
jgi:hypothetical protein